MNRKHSISTVKHYGVENFVFVEENIERYQFKNTSEQNLIAPIDKLNFGNRWIFQQDNDLKHTAHI